MSSQSSNTIDNFQQPHNNEPLPASIILLNGFPGVGKYSIAKYLSSKLASTNTPSRLIDNHLLIDPAIAIEPIRNKAHYKLRKAFRKTAFEGFKGLREQEENEGLVIIFTTALSTSDTETPYDDIEQFGEYVNLAEEMNVLLVLVNITCNLTINFKRLQSGERSVEKGKTKLTDAETLCGIRRKTTLLSKQIAMECNKKEEIVYFEVDTSEMNVEEAAQEIWKFLLSAQRS